MIFSINLDCGTYQGEFECLPGLTAGVLQQTSTDNMSTATSAITNFLSSHGARMPTATFVNLNGVKEGVVNGFFGMGSLNLSETNYLQWWDAGYPLPSVYADGGYCRRYELDNTTYYWDIHPSSSILSGLINHTKDTCWYAYSSSSCGASVSYLATDENLSSVVGSDGLINIDFQTAYPLFEVHASLQAEKIGEDASGRNVYRYTYAAHIGTLTGNDLSNTLRGLKAFLNGTVPTETSAFTDPFNSGGNSGGQGAGGASGSTGVGGSTGQGSSGTGGGSAGGGVSGTGGSGGTGSQNWSTDDVPINALPSVSASDAGFITIYNPSLSELRSLASYMWSDLFSLDTLKKLFLDPMDIILGLNLVPVPVPDGGRSSLKIAGFSTGITMTKAASQYVTVNCGSVTIDETWGAYLDYSPYTKVQLYLPYIGTVNIDTDDVMGRTVTITYKVDILTGACLAQIHCSGGSHCDVNSVLYHFSGNCAQNIPVTGSNFSNLISSMMTLVSTTAMTVSGIGAAGAAISAAQADVAAASAGKRLIDATSYAGQEHPRLSKWADQASAEARIEKGNAHVATAEAARSMGIARGVQSAVGTVMSSKPQISRSGSLSAVSGFFGVQYPYFIITAPRQSLPFNYNNYVGYPSNITEYVSGLKGYTVFEKIILENMPCTDSELAELYELLYSGVYL